MPIQDILETIKQDPKLKEAMETLQLTEKSFRFLPLFPLIYIAWADGKLQEEEIEKILDIANENDLTEGDGAGVLSVWLNPNKRPSDAFFTAGLRLVSGVLKHTELGYKGNLLLLCEAVAEAAGGISGHRVVSSEKKALGQMSELLGIEGKAGYEMLLARMEKELSPDELTWIPSRINLKWLAISAVVSVCSAAVVFFALWNFYPSFVVTTNHMAVFMVLGLLLPQVGFFLGSLSTARLSPGDTSQEGVMGTVVAIALAIFVGFFFINTTSKKFAGYNVALPEPLVLPQCELLKDTNRACVRVTKHKGKEVCRRLRNSKVAMSSGLQKIYRDWFPRAACVGSPAKAKLFQANAKGPMMYSLELRPERLSSKGYYPLCEETHKDNVPCIRVVEHKKKKQLTCRLMPNSKTSISKVSLGKKFEDWYPAPRYCRAVYTRIHALWKAKGIQKTFVGFLPQCSDLGNIDQECIHLSRIFTSDKKGHQKVCLVASGPKIPANEITPHEQPYQNWYPLDTCRQVVSTTPLLIIFSVLGFALMAFFSSWLGGLAGERWQGTI